MKHLKFPCFIALIVMAMLIMQSCSREVKNFEFASKFYKIQLTDTVPFVKYFSVDALGNGKLVNNPVQWKKDIGSGEYILSKISDSEVKIYRKGAPGKILWTFNFEEKQFSVMSNYDQENILKKIDFRFDKQKNHTTLLGEMTEKNKTRLPAVLHFPDMGTFQLRADKQGVIVDYDASRNIGENFIAISLPGATASQTSVKYSFSVTSIYPKFPGVEGEKFAGFRRNYLNLFQINPKLQVLANNSCASPCGFTLFLSSILALKTPSLVDSLSTLDLLRMSIERYLNGMKAYGIFGYNHDWEGKSKAIGIDVNQSHPFDSLDTWPSLVISACNYIKGSQNIQWAELYYPKIKEWMDKQMSRDYNKNGLVEYELSGNSGSWNGVVRPANWWDTIGFGHEDAFSNAITYDALNQIVKVAQLLGRNEDAEKYRILAGKLKDSYFKTFYNPPTGVLAGWKSKDGKLHDYYFLTVNSMAVYYNLVPEQKIKEVMTTLWNKMQEVGFTDFTLGIPGNLIPVTKEDYTDRNPRYGYCDKNEDAFQRYENGGASINWSYFTLKAFKKAGLDQPLSKIQEGILQGIEQGLFQGYSGNSKMTRDWKSWKGECWGYEGYLCDGYLVLLALNPQDE